MKKFLQEFKEFISKGNVMDLAVGVIIGGAFSSIVTSLTDNIIKPLINCIGGAEVQGKIHLVGENYIDYGAFVMVKIVNKAVALGKKLEPKSDEKEEAPTTKICPFCKTEINIDAVRCPNCTSVLNSEEK